ncbi:unnamed protein product [Leptidea sinapis]|uniref:Farnesyl pyrophosphate synthase n=1 Tax=Leptidea sinapis TaxID=189913 RepID=A0A5E4QJ78_9NEOP|nr:unnamed protein product [Leptidea sinapis]
MFSSKRSVERFLQLYRNEIRRQISKTTSVTNSDAMSPRLDQTFHGQNEETGLPKKLMKLQKYHRYLSTLTHQEMPLAARGLAVSKDQSREFMACFPDIVRGLTESGKHVDVPEASKRLAKLLQYNVPNGKKNRGLATVLAYKMIEKKENLTPENIHLANIMGWCTEMMLLKCAIGRFLEKELHKTNKPDLSQFVMEKYEAITKYKTSYYTFQMPISLALLMAGVDDPETHRQAKNILLAMGEFFQIQNDVLDCFGDPAVTGKVGTDIQDGKCTWLAVVALQRASPAQRQMMENHYGSSNPDDVNKIKDLYEEVQLPHTYSVYEEATFNLLLGRMSTNVSIPMHISREIETFQDTYPRIFDTLSKNPGIQENPKVCSWLKTVLDYNLHGGKKARGLATVSSYEILAKPENVTEEMLEISRVMGWCVEMLQAYFLMIDDIMDGAPTRRGAPCWYRRPEVGLGALNDAILVQAAMYDIIKVYCIISHVDGPIFGLLDGTQEQERLHTVHPGAIQRHRQVQDIVLHIQAARVSRHATQ